jgi:hypothetical protein
VARLTVLQWGHTTRGIVGTSSVAVLSYGGKIYMPEWVWGLIVVGVLIERLTKVKVFDFARGLIHLEFSEGKTDKQLKPVSQRKRIGK